MLDVDVIPIAKTIVTGEIAGTRSTWHGEHNVDRPRTQLARSPQVADLRVDRNEHEVASNQELWIGSAPATIRTNAARAGPNQEDRKERRREQKTTRSFARTGLGLSGLHNERRT